MQVPATSELSSSSFTTTNMSLDAKADSIPLYSAQGTDGQIVYSDSTSHDFPMKDNNAPDVSKDVPEPAPSKSASLQAQIQALVSLQSRIALLRNLPAQLLLSDNSQSSLLSLTGVGLGISLSSVPNVSSAANSNGTTETDPISSLLQSDGTITASKAHAMTSQSRNVFRILNETKDELLKSLTQDALRISRNSEISNTTANSFPGRRERKRRRITTADSPAPFPLFQSQSPSTFPPLQQKDMKGCVVGGLPSFIRDVNKDAASPDVGGLGHKTKLNIWLQSRPMPTVSRRVSDFTSIRVAIQDVANIFVRLTCRGSNDRLFVESVVALGPREKRSPHGHSDFTVYQKLTQEIVGMVEKEPSVSFPQLMDLLVSYEDLFLTRCSVCERVLSQEGHIPPVSRKWIESSGTNTNIRGRWDARHIGCLHV